MDEFDRLYEAARALGEETRFRIYRELCTAEHPSSVGQLAQAFSLHPNAIRSHVSRLEQAGVVVSTLERSTGAGRPRRLYEASPELLEFSYPTRPTKALLEMLAGAIDTLPSDRRSLVAFGKTWGRNWASRRRNGTPPRSRKAQVDLLVGQMREWGWRPTTRLESGRTRITTRECLFGHMAHGTNGRCCALEEGMLRGLAEAALGGPAKVIRTGRHIEIEI